MGGVIPVRPEDDVPVADVARHSTARVKVRGNAHFLSEPVRVLPACTHAEVPTGRVQIVTRSPGTARPVSWCVVFPCTARGPAAVGGKVARIDNVPVTAEEYPVVIRHDSVDPAELGTGRRSAKCPAAAAVVVATVVY